MPSLDNYTPYKAICPYACTTYRSRGRTEAANLTQRRALVPRRWWTLVAVGLATFMTYLDNNVTNVAIPTIQRSLHLSIAGLEWVVSSYILVFAGLLLAGGRLA